MTAKDAKAVKGPTITTPIEPLSSELARVYTHIHPFLVLGLFYARFSSTVLDPVASLGQLILPICVLQALYVVLCLPIAPSARQNPPSQPSSTGKSTSQSQQQHQQRRKLGPTKSSFALTSKIIPTLLSTTLSLAIGTPLITILLILHGAPLTTHLAHTLLAGAHLSLLATLPLFYVHGVAGVKWRDLVALAAPIDEVLGAAMGTLIGAWVGAIPIPLDWDREWQKWPVTVVHGAVLGWAVGKVIGGTVGKGRKIEFD